MIKDLKITLGQIEVKTGDITGNTERVLDAISKARADKSDILVLPETCITGYCCGSLFNNIDFINENMAAIDKISGYVPATLHVVLGFVDLLDIRKNGYPDISNSVAIMNSGSVIYTYNKQCMANSGHHEDKKYFTPGTRSSIKDLTIRGQRLRVGTPICEDVWFMDHVRNIPYEMVNMGAEILLVCNQSYFTYDKMITRNKMYSDLNKQLQIPIIQVNSIGVGDIVKNFMIFDGGSSININGCSVHLEQFKNYSQTFDLEELSNKADADLLKPNNYEKYDQIFNGLVFGCQQIFKNCGLNKAQLHLSGGLDSSIVSVILSKAFKKEDILFISNPTSFNGTETKGYVKHISDKLDIPVTWNPMGSIADEYIKVFKESFGEEASSLSKSTSHAVGRTVQALMASNQFKTGIVCTGNHTENILGWANFHDVGSIGLVALIGDLTKTELYLLSEFINKKFNDEIIPVNLFNDKFKPAAELPDSSEDPFDYWVVSGICSSIIRYRMNKDTLSKLYTNKGLPIEDFPNDFSGKTIYQRINKEDFDTEIERCFNLMKRSVFKSAQHAPNLILSKLSRGFSDRECLINHYKY